MNGLSLEMRLLKLKSNNHIIKKQAFKYNITKGNSIMDILKDKISFTDLDPAEHSGLWAKTEIIGGHGFIPNELGKSTLGEVLFTESNIVPIGGVSFVFEKLFGVKEKQITVPSLYTKANIGLPDKPNTTATYTSPDGSKVSVYPVGNLVQLFGIGTTGTSENDATIYHPDYRENAIILNKQTADGKTVTGTMLPFRHTVDTLNEKEKKLYFGKKAGSDNLVSYYLKRFETEPVIKHIWKNKSGDTEELVKDSEVWTNSASTNTVESFVEMHIKIHAKDVKEYYTSLNQLEKTRFNTFALFTGEFVPGTSVGKDHGDYQNVKMFSKFCMNPQYLDIAGDLDFIYRIYGA